MERHRKMPVSGQKVRKDRTRAGGLGVEAIVCDAIKKSPRLGNIPNNKQTCQARNGIATGDRVIRISWSLLISDEQHGVSMCFVCFTLDGGKGSIVSGYPRVHPSYSVDDSSATRLEPTL